MPESKHHEYCKSGRNSHVINVENYNTDILSPELCFLDLCKTELSKVGKFYASECIYVPLLFIILLSSFSSVFTEFVSMFLSFLCCSSIIMTHYLLCHCKEVKQNRYRYYLEETVDVDVVFPPLLAVPSSTCVPPSPHLQQLPDPPQPVVVPVAASWQEFKQRLGSKHFTTRQTDILTVNITSKSDILTL